ncbi:MYXO-CTERM sorting domain-containing protein [Corallococcus sp. CA049B]|uniref:MYXO-CTERM sorting domain-containing protein n=1 Tax=Corallococcus sp. CA049B TaxID=2316730 RepID=UPI0013154552|nr:MYXO-CTERM sorting domain-containing protein [Corallococcus sp. CA049B]
MSNEFSLESPRYGRLLASVRSSRAATGGGVTLLVWSDERRGERSAFYGTGPEIYAARIDADGNVLDPAGIPLCTASYAQEAPAVTWDGKQFLVVWQDYRDNRNYAIYGARVSPDGTVTTPPDGFRISAPIPAIGGEWEEQPAVASSGGVSLVVWQRRTRRTSDNDLLGARIRDDGTVLDPTPQVLVSGTGNQANPTVAGGPDGYLVVWQDGRHQVGETLEWDIYATRVALSGEVMDAAGLPVSVLASSYQTYPRALFDGTNYQVLWGDSRNSSYGDFYGGRVSVAGEPLDGTGVRITPASSDYKQGPAIAFDGTQTWVVWRAATGSYDEHFYGVRFGRDGVVKDTTRVPLFTHSGQKTLQDLYFDGARLRAVWTEYVGVYGLKSARFETDGTVVDGAGRFLAWGANFQDAPSVASAGGTGLMAWRDQVGEEAARTASIRIQPLDADGQPTGDVRVFSSPTYVGRPAVGAGDGMYLVAWGQQGSSGYDIKAQRVRPDGALIDAQPLTLATSTLSGPASVASAGNTFFVVWEATGSRITGVMLREDGLVSSLIQLPRPASNTQTQLQPKVAFNGTHFLAVWANYNGDYDIHAARVSPTGQLVDAVPRIISAAGSFQYEPDVAAHGDFLVTWSDYRRGGGLPEIRAARVASDGTLKDPDGKVIVSDYSLKRFAQPMFDGSGFTLLWQQGSEAFMGLKLARVSLDGTVLTPAPLDVWPSQDNASPATLSLLAPHKAVIVYQRFDSGPGLYVNRVHGRVLSITPDEPTPDAGSGDAGQDSGVDAGTDGGGGDTDGGGDAGTDGGVDAGTDGGTRPDAGTTVDAGTAVDAGTGSPEEPEDSGCGCSSAGAPVWGFLPLALLLRRRRARAA